MTDDILRQQIEYYRARAGEYDEWYYRKGRYDHGEALNRQWFDECAQTMRLLEQQGHAPRALEFAAGTGIWTEQLVRLSDHVTALDASAEVFAVNREKIRAAGADARVEYVQTDIFAWQPTQEYDLVVFCFWLSHVPAERFDAFIDTVQRALRPGGKFFMVDSVADKNSSAKDHVIDREASFMTRRLNDGREFQIVKIFYDPAELQARFEQHGFATTASTTEHYFLYAYGTKR
ncbi:MAG: class I SAM-dependent methyltransferase [Anaerolineae bacterium]